ncbi:MAG: protein kinase [Phycisphaerales bacterium]|nr:protein kinase [Phycisphaerales bacterium]
MTQVPSTSTSAFPVIPGYQVIDRLGSGATATVYKARQLTLDRLVAIKVLNRRAGSDVAYARKLLSEGRAAAKLNHPNAVQAYDVGQVGDLLYFVMEYIEGSTVQQRLQRQGRYPLDEAIQIILQVAQACSRVIAWA